MKVLIGHTGFVGRNLSEAYDFDQFHNSSNIEKIRGTHADVVMCAGAPAAKWIANANPDADAASIDKLIDALEATTAEEFVLISTIDVYGHMTDVTELDRPVVESLHAYGHNRFRLEEFVRGHFSRHLIIRLPALYGRHLKKNALFDLINDNNIASLDPRSRFQWYPLSRLHADIETFRSSGLQIVNMATEPLKLGDIAVRSFPTVKLNEKSGAPANYLMRSIHADSYGGKNGYFLNQDELLSDIDRFVREST